MNFYELFRKENKNVIYKGCFNLILFASKLIFVIFIGNMTFTILFTKISKFNLILLTPKKKKKYQMNLYKINYKNV